MIMVVMSMTNDLRRPCAESRLPAPARPGVNELSREYLHDFIVFVCLDIREICDKMSNVLLRSALVFSHVFEVTT